MNVTLEKEFYSSADIAELFGVTVRTVQHWMSGKGSKTRLPVIKIGKRVFLVTRGDLENFLGAHYDQPVKISRAKYRTQKTELRNNKTVKRMNAKENDEYLREVGVIR